MKLWILKRKARTTFDEYAGFVVRAESAEQARRLASEQRCAGDEDPGVWLDDDESTCEELRADGDAGVVLSDYLPG